MQGTSQKESEQERSEKKRKSGGIGADTGEQTGAGIGGAGTTGTGTGGAGAVGTESSPTTEDTVSKDPKSSKSSQNK